MTRRLYASLILMLVLSSLVVLIAACGGSPAPEVPTATPLPPTPTPVTPTATPVPPTATPLPTPAATATGGGASAGGSLADALSKAKEATAYRVDLQMTTQGSLNPLGGTPEAEATPLDLPLITMKGDVNGLDSHVTLQGLFAGLLGVDPNKGLEMITVEGKTYIHGPVPLLGAAEDKWYELPAEQAAAAQPPLHPSTLLESFTSSGMKPEDFQKSGTETLDNRSCDVYSGDKETVVKAFQSASEATGQADGSLENLDTAELKFWVCDDGYVHQTRMFVEGSSKDKPNEKGSFLLLMHLTDIGANITIQPPPNASPLEVPSFGLPTTTP